MCTMHTYILSMTHCKYNINKQGRDVKKKITERQLSLGLNCVKWNDVHW